MDYLNLFSSISNNGKYAKWYENMMRTAQVREPIEGGERHHIIPRSFGMGGSTSKVNIVALTGREHFIAHRLLYKSLSDPVLKKKALFAVFQMSTRMKVSSRVAGPTRDLVAEAMRELWADESYRGKQAAAAKTKYASNEYRNRRSELAKRQMSNPDQRANAAKILADAHSVIDHASHEWTRRSFLSESAAIKRNGTVKTPAFRAACREREMRKPDAARLGLAKAGAAALRDKFPDEQAYKQYLSSRIKGRVKIVDLETLNVRVVRSEDIPTGWVLYKSLSKEQKSQIRAGEK